MVSVKGPLNFLSSIHGMILKLKRLPCGCRRICFLSLYFVFCICSKRSVGGGSVLRLHQRHHRLQAAGGFWQVAQLSSGPLNYFKIVICPIFRGIISRRSAAVRAGGQWLVRTGVEWDSVGALTLARPDVALRWEARGAWLVSALLSIHPVL